MSNTPNTSAFYLAIGLDPKAMAGLYSNLESILDGDGDV